MRRPTDSDGNVLKGRGSLGCGSRVLHALKAVQPMYLWASPAQFRWLVGSPFAKSRGWFIYPKHEGTAFQRFTQLPYLGYILVGGTAVDGRRFIMIIPTLKIRLFLEFCDRSVLKFKFDQKKKKSNRMKRTHHKLVTFNLTNSPTMQYWYDCCHRLGDVQHMSFSWALHPLPDGASRVRTTRIDPDLVIADDTHLL